MPKYRVERKEVYNVTYLIEAKDSQEALKLVSDGAGVEVDVDYWKDLAEYPRVDTQDMVYLDEEIT